jgi:hypothetical protein
MARHADGIRQRLASVHKKASARRTAAGEAFSGTRMGLAAATDQTSLGETPDLEWVQGTVVLTTPEGIGPGHSATEMEFNTWTE